MKLNTFIFCFIHNIFLVDINPQQHKPVNEDDEVVDDASKWNEMEQDLSAAAQLFNLQVFIYFTCILSNVCLIFFL